MSHLFDTDAISELVRKKPAPRFLEWVASLPREAQYTSAVVVGELFSGAHRSRMSRHHLRNIEQRVLPAVTVLPYDTAIAREFGRLRADLEARGRRLPDADIQIAATAIYHGLTLVTGNLKHFERFPDLRLSRRLTDAR